MCISMSLLHIPQRPSDKSEPVIYFFLSRCCDGDGKIWRALKHDITNVLFFLSVFQLNLSSDRRDIQVLTKLLRATRRLNFYSEVAFFSLKYKILNNFPSQNSRALFYSYFSREPFSVRVYLAVKWQLICSKQR